MSVHRRGDLGDIGSGNGFLNIPPKAQATKEKVNKLDFINNEKNFHGSKDIIQKMKR